MEITKEKCREIRERAEELLKPLVEEMGIEANVGNATYGHSSATFKVEFRVLSEDGTPTGKDAEAFKRYEYRHGISPDALGVTFKLKGEDFRITGYRPRATKNPVLVEKVDTGHPYVVPEGMVKAAIPPEFLN